MLVLIQINDYTKFPGEVGKNFNFNQSKLNVLNVILQ